MFTRPLVLLFLGHSFAGLCHLDLCSTAFAQNLPWQVGAYSIDSELSAPVPVANESFAADVSLSGGLALFSLPGDGTTGVDFQTGAPEGRVSVRGWGVGGPGAWGEIASLTPPDPAQSGGFFGTAVALSGSLAAVSSKQNALFSFDGEVSLFDAPSATWIATVRVLDFGVSFFGQAVDTDGARVLVGANRVDPGPPAQLFKGRAYLYDSSGNLQNVLDPSDGGANWRFGESVAIDGAWAAVGAVGANAPLASNAGAVYVYDTNTGVELFKLTASDASFAASFGHSLAIDGDRLLVGASAGGPTGMGRAYVFDLNTGLELDAFDGGGSGSGFGWSVDLFGDRAYVGALVSTGKVDDVPFVGRIFCYDLDYGYLVNAHQNPDASDFSPSPLGYNVQANGLALIDGYGGAVGPGIPVEAQGRAYAGAPRALGFGINKGSTFPGDSIQLSLRGGAAFGAFGFALVATNNVPLGVPVILGGGAAPGLLDAQGQVDLGFSIPAGLTTPVKATLIGVGITKAGAIELTNTVSIELF